MQFAPGQRVVIRFSLADGSATDALGRVIEQDERSVTVDTPRGPVAVPRADILLAHEVPPPPARREVMHRAVSAVDLQRILASTWAPPETAWLHRDNVDEDAAEETVRVHDGWLLRAGLGVTRRANSALALGPAGMPIDEAIALTEDWYRARETRPAVSMYAPDATSPVDPELDAALAARGYELTGEAAVMTAAAREAAGGATHPGQVDAEQLRFDTAATPSEEYFQAIAATRGAKGAEEQRQLAVSAPEQVFLTAIGQRPDGGSVTVGFVRVAMSHKWAVLSNLVVRPDLRRRGAGRALTQAAAALASGRGVRAVALQVETHNAPATELYEALGFVRHHLAHYRRLG